MTNLAVLSLHTSPLAQPGRGDSGGMNVYVRELAGSLARAGVATDVFVRRWSDDLPDIVEVEPGMRVVHVPAGAHDLPKEALPEIVDEFADGVAQRLDPATGALHANYWLSGVAGHRLKHELGLPLVATFHTLARVKAETGDPEPARRAQAETDVIACADAILASCQPEANQLIRLYGADPARIEIIPPAVDHAFFSPGPRAGARAALGLDDRPLVLFVGRIQPLKGLDVAVDMLRSLDTEVDLMVIGGASGADGAEYLDRVEKDIARHGLGNRIHFVDPQPHHALGTYYRAADVCIVPSRSESFGLVALEAAACGTPVVAAAVGGLRSILEHGRTGFLVEGRDPAVFASYVNELLSVPGLAAEIGQAASEQAAAYTWSTAAGRLRRLYSDLVSAGSPLLCAA